MLNLKLRLPKLLGAIAVTAAMLTGGAAKAEYPDSTIHIILPWKAGGGTDTILRGYQKAFEKAAGVTVVIDNINGAKSVTGTLIGAAAERGLIDIDAPAPVAEWKDARAAITWNDLMRMQSGLAFDETYGDPSSDVSRMLFAAHEAAAVAASQKPIYAPGARWAYSSGTTNILARALRTALEATGADYHAFPAEALFSPLGAASATMEVDSAGNFIGSSYAYATARDWAKLGQLYLNDGVWNGVRLLPEGWSAYVASPTAASDGEYGAQFWLNRDGDGRQHYLPGAPENVYYFAGHEGQYVFIVPDSNAVIARTGITRGAVPIQIVAPTLARIVAAIGEPAGSE